MDVGGEILSNGQAFAYANDVTYGYYWNINNAPQGYDMSPGSGSLDGSFILEGFIPDYSLAHFNAYSMSDAVAYYPGQGGHTGAASASCHMITQ